MQERRNGVARVIFNRLREERRIVDRTILNEVQYRFNAALQYGDFSAYRMAFGPNPGDAYPRLDSDEDLALRRMRRSRVSLRSDETYWPWRKKRRCGEMVKSKLRKILDRKQTFEKTETAESDSVSLYMYTSRRRDPVRRGRAAISDIHATGATAKPSRLPVAAFASER